MNYKDFYKSSIDNPELFWKTKAKNLAWYKTQKIILRKDQYSYTQWFKDGELNVSYLCIDKHIKDGYRNKNAIIYDLPITNRGCCFIKRCFSSKTITKNMFRKNSS